MQDKIPGKDRLKRKETQLHMDAHCIKSTAAAPNTPRQRPGQASGHDRGALTFSSSSMLHIMWAQVVKISTARERVRIPYTWERVTAGL